MSDRYTPIAANIDGEPDGENYIAKTVYEREERKPEFTGLYDASGTKLYRVPAPPRPIGFVRFGGEQK